MFAFVIVYFVWLVVRARCCAFGVLKALGCFANGG